MYFAAIMSVCKNVWTSPVTIWMTTSTDTQGQQVQVRFYWMKAITGLGLHLDQSSLVSWQADVKTTL